jgi:hypothetical protein
MRDFILLLVAAAACPSCASTHPAEAPAPAAPDAAAVTIQLHEVRDLLDPPGDAAKAAALADEIRTALASGRTAGAPEPSVVAHGTAILVVADAKSQAVASRRLRELRAAKAP